MLALPLFHMLKKALSKTESTKDNHLSSIKNLTKSTIANGEEVDEENRDGSLYRKPNFCDELTGYRRNVGDGRDENV